MTDFSGSIWTSDMPQDSPSPRVNPFPTFMTRIVLNFIAPLFSCCCLAFSPSYLHLVSFLGRPASEEWATKGSKYLVNLLWFRLLIWI